MNVNKRVVGFDLPCFQRVEGVPRRESHTAEPRASRDLCISCFSSQNARVQVAVSGREHARDVEGIGGGGGGTKVEKLID